MISQPFYSNTEMPAPGLVTVAVAVYTVRQPEFESNLPVVAANNNDATNPVFQLICVRSTKHLTSMDLNLHIENWSRPDRQEELNL